MSRYRGGPTTTLYIRNISDRVRYEDLRRLFQKYGKIIDVTIPLDYYSGMPKGYCFVEYEDTRDAEEAQYRMDRQRLFGREIEVEFARGDRKTPGEMRTRDPRDPPGEMRGRDPRERDRRGDFGGRGGYDAPRGDYRGGASRRGPEYERYERRSRSRSQHSRTERRGGERAARGKPSSKTREASYSRSRSRGSRSYSKNRTPSPKNHHAKSESRDRSRSRDRSTSRHRSSSRRNEARSPRMNNDMSRSVSPA